MHYLGLVLVDVATFQVSHATLMDVEATTLRTTIAKVKDSCGVLERYANVGKFWRENSLHPVTQHTHATVSIPSG
mgnify:CR=1 FL=1